MTDAILNTAKVQVESFRIESLHCADELALIETGLRTLPGLVEVRPNYLSRTLQVEFHPGETSAHQIDQRLRQIGFPPASDSATHQARSPASARLRLTTSLAGLLLAAALVGHVVWPRAWIPAALAVASAVLAGWPVARAAWRSIRLRRVDMNVLMTIAAVGAVATAEWYEAATAMFLFGIAVWLESYSMHRAQRAVHTLVGLTPDVAHRIEAGADLSAPARGASDISQAVSDVSLDHLTVGDHVLVKPGERIAVDGVVRSGQSTVNQAPITGESVPVDKMQGDRVYAGSLNGNGVLVMEMDRSPDDSTLAHVRRLIEQAEASRSPTQRFVDRFAARYTPAVIALAVCLSVIPPLLSWLGSDWPADADFRAWLHRGLVLLVIACPCALVISTPITIVCGLRRAARNGILVKGGEFLEAMSAPDCIAFDKTGTLTIGSPRVVQVIAEDELAGDQALLLAASLEAKSEHPLAAAIVQAAERRGLVRVPAESITSLPGLGVEGKIDGRAIVVASPRYFETDAAIPAFAAQGNSHDGATVALVASDAKIIGAILFADELRPHARKTIEQLHGQGVSRISMLTGDHESAAKAISQETGIDDVYWGLLPAEKVQRVEELARQFSNVVMVGDGVNDAPALATARVGIALGSQSSDTAMETADVVIMTPRLSRLPELIQLARQTRRHLTQNIVLALSIKLIVLALAATGHATMWMAVAADVGASLLVILNGTRLLAGSDAIK